MIEVKNVSKQFGRLKALDDLSFTVERGQVYGLIGPNGAGKTTVMRILVTLLRADSGSAFIDGIDVMKNPREVRGIVGYMPDFFGVYHSLTAREYLQFFADAYCIPRAKQQVIIDELFELVNLEDKADSYVDNLSRGMKQRLALARCLIHEPKVLVLDEPASGLDPRARVELKEIISKLKQLGKTVLISSHILPELSEMCDAVGVMEKGKMIASGSIEEIYSRVFSKVIKIKALDEHVESVVEQLKSYKNVSYVKKSNGWIEFNFSGNNAAQADLLKSLSQSYGILQFVEHIGSLEDIFMAVTSEVKEERS